MSMTKAWIGPVEEEHNPYEHIATLKIIVGGGPKMQKCVICCFAGKGSGGLCKWLLMQQKDKMIQRESPRCLRKLSKLDLGFLRIVV